MCSALKLVMVRYVKHIFSSGYNLKHVGRKFVYKEYLNFLE